MFTSIISFNPFQGIQVLSDTRNILSGFRQASFNPFQGIQVLSVNAVAHIHSIVVLFQSLSGNSSVVGWEAEEGTVLGKMFQSLSGNSSVVGKCNAQDKRNRTAVSIPFREFKCCRPWRPCLMPTHGCFNPFQGIQVLSVFGFWGCGYISHWVSIPFREFKCCRWYKKAFFWVGI